MGVREPELLQDASSVREYISRISGSRSTPEALDDVVEDFIADAEYTVGNRRSDGADWEWPDLEYALQSARTWQECGRTSSDFDDLIDQLECEAERIEEDVRGAVESQ